MAMVSLVMEDVVIVELAEILEALAIVTQVRGGGGGGKSSGRCWWLALSGGAGGGGRSGVTSGCKLFLMPMYP